MVIETYGYLEENLAIPFLIKSSKGRKTAKKDRIPLSYDNLYKLFHSKYFIDRLDYTLTFQAEKYWIPIISLFAGLRQNKYVNFT